MPLKKWAKLKGDTNEFSKNCREWKNRRSIV